MIAITSLARTKAQEYFLQLGCTRYLLKSYIIDIIERFSLSISIYTELNRGLSFLFVPKSGLKASIFTGRLSMTQGVFYCYQMPLSNLAKIDWIVGNPIRDWELEAELNQPVWRVQYNPAHPNMQKFNRFDTCTSCQFFGVVFDDDVEDNFEEECQEATLLWH